MGLLDWIPGYAGSDAGGAPPVPPNQAFIDATNSYDGAGGRARVAPLRRYPDPGAPPPVEMLPPPAPPPPVAGGGDFDQNGLPPASPGATSFSPLTSRPPMPPNAAPMGAGDPPPGLPPMPMPQARPPGAPPMPNAAPPLPPQQPPAAPPNLGPSPSYPGLAVAPPSSEVDAALGRLKSPGDAGLLGSVFGMNPHDAMMVRGSLGAGLKAAGESAGKSPFQAATAGAGAALEGGEKAGATNNKQTLDYLNAAIKAQQAGDTAAYNTNYTKYLAAKLKADTDKAASGSTKANSPEQLYFQAVRSTNADPALKGYNDAIRAARASGDTAALAKAQGDLERAKTEVMNGHLGRVGLDPVTAGKIAQQPGMTTGTAIDAGKMGITEKNIAQKLQPGQYYRNPKDGQVYQFNGGPATGSTPSKPTTPTEPRDPNRPERGPRVSATAPDDEAEG